MQDPKKLQQSLRKIPTFNKFLARGEIKSLNKVLWEDEEPEDIIEGIYNRGHGLLVATNKRLIFIDKGIFSLTVEDFPYDKITSIMYHEGLIFGNIDIFVAGNREEIKQILKNRVRPFAEAVRNKISLLSSHVPQRSNGTDDKYANLEKLNELKEKGIISEREFNQEKRKILS